MNHLFCIISDDIYTLDNAQEIDDAVDALKDARLGHAKVWCGPAGSAGVPANKLLTDAGLINVSADCFERTT